MPRTEALQLAYALEPSPSGWDADQDDAHDAIADAAEEMIEAGMHATRVEELLGRILCAAMGEMA